MDEVALIGELEGRGLGLRRGTVDLAPFSEGWLEAYRLLEHYIRDAVMGAWVSHVGSTAVAGGVAKPILDILVEYEQDRHFAEETRALVALGFTSKGERGVAGRSFFTFYDAAEDYDFVHIHAYPSGHKEVSAHEVFRDRLCQDAETLTRYTQLKLRLKAEGVSREDYPEAKTAFILETLRGVDG